MITLTLVVWDFHIWCPAWQHILKFARIWIKDMDKEGKVGAYFCYISLYVVLHLQYM